MCATGIWSLIEGFLRDWADISVFKQRGTSHSFADLLKIYMKMGVRWWAQAFRQAADLLPEPCFLSLKELTYLLQPDCRCRFTEDGCNGCQRLKLLYGASVGKWDYQTYSKTHLANWKRIWLFSVASLCYSDLVCECVSVQDSTLTSTGFVLVV